MFTSEKNWHTQQSRTTFNRLMVKLGNFSKEKFIVRQTEWQNRRGTWELRSFEHWNRWGWKCDDTERTQNCALSVKYPKVIYKSSSYPNNHKKHIIRWHDVAAANSQNRVNWTEGRKFQAGKVFSSFCSVIWVSLSVWSYFFVCSTSDDWMD